MKRYITPLLLFLSFTVLSQDPYLTIDRIYASGEFRQQYAPPMQWMEQGDAYVKVESDANGQRALYRYETKSGEQSLLVAADKLIPQGSAAPISIESFTFSEDESRILFFTNSSRVWRANTKGDYWVYDRNTGVLKQIGADFPPSSLMFAKFSADNKSVAYVQEFNLYVEDAATGEVKQLTNTGGDGIINGTFDWVYEEEFGARDGFRWNPGGNTIAFWNLDASQVGTFYMINNTDSIYSQIIPIQYPKVGQDPSPTRVGIVDITDGSAHWVELEGSIVQNYVPGIQWLNEETLLLQQINRHQNTLKVWAYTPITKDLRLVYTEKEETWVDIQYPDVSANGWGKNSLRVVDNGRAFLRMTETDGWRHLYKIDIESGEMTLLTPGDFDVASLEAVTDDHAYFHASPENSTQRYLYQVDLKGKGKIKRITPDNLSGMNLYASSPNGKYALHTHGAAMEARTVDLITLPDHALIQHIVDNKGFSEKLETLAMPQVEFFQVTTEDGIEIDGRMIKPVGFDASKKYPVLFHVYGEPWGQVAVDNFVGLWNIMLAQQGYVVIDMDNRGTPCLKGSEWRKSIYRKVGVINANDQGQAARAALKAFPFLDPARTAVWGWSGGGSMTLNLMFRFPDVYTTGMSVAPVSDQLVYDNVYQERYMGLPQENLQDFIDGSPITYAGNLKGNLLLVHGTADDNVHYQSAEKLVNKLIEENKQFQMMSYPNRSHGIYEGQNTRRHLYTLLTQYLNTHVPVNSELPGETNISGEK